MFLAVTREFIMLENVQPNAFKSVSLTDLTH